MQADAHTHWYLSLVDSILPPPSSCDSSPNLPGFHQRIISKANTTTQRPDGPPEWIPQGVYYVPSFFALSAGCISAGSRFWMSLVR